jgi:hypothetical protein
MSVDSHNTDGWTPGPVSGGPRSGSRNRATTRTCRDCGQALPLDAFGRRKGRGETVRIEARCRDCECERVRKRNRAQREAAKGSRLATLRVQWGRRKGEERWAAAQLKKEIAILRSWGRRSRVELAKRKPLSLDDLRLHWRHYQAMRRRRDREITRARRAVQRAVAAGRMAKPNLCTGCGKVTERSLLHGHHHLGYHRPFAVRWLCPACHVIAEGAWGGALHRSKGTSSMGD